MRCWRVETVRGGVFMLGCPCAAFPVGRDGSADALSVHGGPGCLEDEELVPDVRDAIGRRIYSGTSDVQGNAVARAMGL